VLGAVASGCAGFAAVWAIGLGRSAGPDATEAALESPVAAVVDSIDAPDALTVASPVAPAAPPQGDRYAVQPTSLDRPDGVVAADSRASRYSRFDGAEALPVSPANAETPADEPGELEPASGPEAPGPLDAAPAKLESPRADENEAAAKSFDQLDAPLADAAATTAAPVDDAVTAPPPSRPISRPRLRPMTPTNRFPRTPAISPSQRPPSPARKTSSRRRRHLCQYRLARRPGPMPSPLAISIPRPRFLPPIRQAIPRRRSPISRTQALPPRCSPPRASAAIRCVAIPRPFRSLPRRRSRPIP
jgi:hypothetical protein